MPANGGWDLTRCLTAQCHWFYLTLQGTAWPPHLGRFYRLQTYVSSKRSTDVTEKLPHKHGVRRNLPYILEGCLNVHLPHEILWNAKLMQQFSLFYIYICIYIYIYSPLNLCVCVCVCVYIYIYIYIYIYNDKLLPLQARCGPEGG